VRLGFREVYFVDGTFNASRDWVMEFCDQLRARSLALKWSFRGRVRPMDPGMLEKLREAGCSRIQFGVESGSDDILHGMNKGITLDEVRSAFRWTRQVGIDSMAYFMIGSPGETEAHIRRTVELARELDPDLAVFSIFVPGPGTDFYLQSVRQGGRDYWREFAASPTLDFRVPYWTVHLSREELHEALREAYRGFFFRPGYLLRSLVGLRSTTELRFRTKGGLKMVRDVVLAPAKAH